MHLQLQREVGKAGAGKGVRATKAAPAQGSRAGSRAQGVLGAPPAAELCCSPILSEPGTEELPSLLLVLAGGHK